MKNFYNLILMIVIMAFMASCTSTDRTIKLNYNSKSNSVTSGGIVKRKYQKGFYVNLFKGKTSRKNTVSNDNINPPVATKIEAKQTEDNNSTNNVAQTSNDNSNLLASNNNNEIALTKSNLNFNTVSVASNKQAKSSDRKQIKQKWITNKIMSLVKAIKPTKTESFGEVLGVIFGVIAWVWSIVGIPYIIFNPVSAAWGVIILPVVITAGLGILFSCLDFEGGAGMGLSLAGLVFGVYDIGLLLLVINAVAFGWVALYCLIVGIIAIIGALALVTSFS